MMDVVKDLTCPICLEFYSHPIILPCSHVMCRQPCAENVFEGNFIRCPVCRDNCYVSGGISSLPRVITIESIIEKIRADRKKRLAAAHAQRRDLINTTNDDLFGDVSPESWGHKTSLDDLFSDLGSERLSPDIVPPRSTPLSINGISSTGQLSASGESTPVSSSPDTVGISFGGTLSSSSNPPRTSHLTSSGRVHSIGGEFGNSPRRTNTTHADEARRTMQEVPSSSHFTTIPSLQSSRSTLSQLEGHQQLAPLNPVELPSSQNQPHRHRVYDDQDAFTNYTTVFQTRDDQTLDRRSGYSCTNTGIHANNNNNNNNNNNMSIPTDDHASRSSNINMADHNRRYLDGQSENSSTQSQDDVTPLVRSRADFQPNADMATTPKSGRYPGLKISHQQSLANLQACSNSIRDLQNEHLTFTRRIQTQTISGTDTGWSSFISPEILPQISSPLETSVILASDLEPCIQNGVGRLQRRTVEGAIERSTSSNVVVPVTMETLLNSSDARERRDNDTDIQLRWRNSSEGLSYEGDVGNSCRELAISERMVVNDLKHLLQNQLEKLCNAQHQLVHHMSSYSSQAHREQSILAREREEVNKECDALVAEIENKRTHFLLHLGDDDEREGLNLSDVTVAMETLLESTQHLAQFVGQMLESKPEVLLSTASNVFDRISRAVRECEACLHESINTISGIDDPLSHIDTSIHRSIATDVDCMEVPSRPIIDTQRCVRNTHTVALFLVPPCPSDITEHYEVCYCSEEQKKLGIEERYFAKLSSDADVRDVTSGSFQVLVISNLCMSTHYYFCVCAVNEKGRSPNSDYVQCVTLGEHDCVVPVPTVMEKLSHAHPTSIQMVCPSLATVTAHQEVRHYLLRRSEPGAVVWKGTELCDDEEEEFLVTKLRPQTRYFFLVMACNRRGECQLSPVSTFDTPQLRYLDTESV